MNATTLWLSGYTGGYHAVGLGGFVCGGSGGMSKN